MAALTARLAGRFALEAVALGTGEVCALLKRSVYLRFPGGRFARIGDAALGAGPLNVLVDALPAVALGASLAISREGCAVWTPPAANGAFPGNAGALARQAAPRAPGEGLACLIAGSHNALTGHAQPALDALQRWLVGNALSEEAAGLLGLGAGITAPGDDFLGGLLVGLRLAGRSAQAASLWRWREPRLPGGARAISAAHLRAAAAGEAEAALHEILNGHPALERLDAAGWNALAGALSLAEPY